MSTTKLDSLTKRLLMCMQLGIVISCADGHRWISYCQDDDNFLSADPAYDRFLSYSKVCGTLEDALDQIDVMLMEVEKMTLEGMFDARDLGSSHHGFGVPTPSDFVSCTTSYLRKRIGLAD